MSESVVYVCVAVFAFPTLFLSLFKYFYFHFSVSWLIIIEFMKSLHLLFTALFIIHTLIPSYSLVNFNNRREKTQYPSINMSMSISFCSIGIGGSDFFFSKNQPRKTSKWINRQNNNTQWERERKKTEKHTTKSSEKTEQHSTAHISLGNTFGAALNDQ